MGHSPTKMKQPLWSENLSRLQASLVAQADRIWAGSAHPTIKGTSLEVVLRRTLREYLPGYFTIGSGQAVNNMRGVSPQLDVMIYDQNVFPHLAVNEDSSVMVCCESLLAAVECKTNWERPEMERHFRKFGEVESRRHPHFSDLSNAAAYFVATVVLEGQQILVQPTRAEGIFRTSRECPRASLAGRPFSTV